MRFTDHSSLTVIGAGSYGTALAVSAASKGLKVMLWGRNPQRMCLMAAERCNARYLPGIKFPPTLRLCSDLAEAAAFSANLLIVVPSRTFSSVLQALRPYLRPDSAVAWATKGLEAGSGALLSEVAARLLPEGTPLAALSGPTFAHELAAGMPTAIAVASENAKFRAFLCDLLHTGVFRLYESDDLIALQLGGAVKNVIAIGAGLSDGLGYGANARTALITRGLAEMIRLGLKLGATERGFMGLSGLGDLILTCTDDQSRNRRFGFMLGQGKSASEALQLIDQVVEGYVITKEVKLLSDKLGVSMPICHELHEVLYAGRTGRAAAAALLSRALTTEFR